MAVSDSREQRAIDLQLVIEFVNTMDRDDDVDVLDTPGGLAAWLRARGLLARHARVSEAERRRAVSLREALRALMLENNGAARATGASRVLEHVARRARLAPHFSGGAVEIVPAAKGVDGALARILVPVVHAMQDGSWARAKACRASDCQWAFHDRSRNRSGVWCDMAECGNRSKVRAYRGRQTSRA
jgi:predicted RNA-binding Zn ribbon-like protein